MMYLNIPELSELCDPPASSIIVHHPLMAHCMDFFIVTFVLRICSQREKTETCVNC